MLLLAVDVGNSNIKIGLFEDRNLLSSWRFSTDREKSSDEYGIQLIQFLRHLGYEPSWMDGVIISSVSPGINYTLERMFHTFFSLDPLFVTHETTAGLHICYDVPAELGADRIANAVGAWHLYGGPCITVDFGTATTFGAVDAKGTFLGGAIAPGIRSATDALVSRAAQLHRFDLIQPKTAVATNTVDALQAGVLFGFTGLADHVIERMQREMGPCKVIAAGGLSDIIAGESKYIDIADKLLTLKGLQLIYEKTMTEEKE